MIITMTTMTAMSIELPANKGVVVFPVGPAGGGTYSQLYTVISMIVSFTNLAVQQGLVH